MPFISDAQLSNLQSVYQKQKSQLSNLKKSTKVKEKANQVKSTLECVGAAAAMGFIRGKREDAAGVWNAPLVKFDMEALVGITLVGTALFDVFGKYTDDVLMAGNGILAHYGGQVMRKMAKTGSFSMVAGHGHPALAGHRVGNALPQRAPHGYDPTQFSSPYADPVAAALAQSGL